VVGSILLGSTSLHLATHARCPVVVVRDTRGERAAGAEHRHTGPGGDQPSPTAPVVVGYDGSPGSQDALGFAFTEAAHRHLPLDVVASWEPDVRATARLAPTVADEVRAAAAAQRRDDAVSAVAPWRETYPSVDVRILVTTEQPVPSLLGRSSDASIVVVGSRGLGSVRGPLLGSVSSAVLHGAHCPVAIVRSPAAG
jgi:nucleotide-binding universal stress UspA family protein